MSKLWRSLFAAMAQRNQGAGAHEPLPRAEVDGLASASDMLTEGRIFVSQADVERHAYGYEDGLLNRYIVAKSRRWIDQLQVGCYVWPPHVFAVLWVIHVAQARLGCGLRVLDIGGGAPVVPVVLEQLGLAALIADYVIAESPAFICEVPRDWGRYCEYVEAHSVHDCDLLILSGVLPYLRKPLVKSLYQGIAYSLPRFIYFGRTSFLDESYPLEEVFTIQRSRFGDHGAQIDVGMREVEDKLASYVRRHFKWTEIASVIEPLGYHRLLSLADDSGIENVPGLGLYTNNSLWERHEQQMRLG